ncbi:MAG: chorismate mutase, partial [Victivallales bacterium]|nr:chorismate mutase [Victivallales bacterium]
MKELSELRQQIDDIDAQLVDLLVKRMGIMNDVAEAKREKGISTFAPAREREILNTVMEKAGPEYETELHMIFSTLFNLSKAKQRLARGGSTPLLDAIRLANKNVRDFPKRSMVACQGTEGAYSQQATTRMFSVPTILYFNSFDKVFEAVESGLCPYGVLPIENSSAGSVVSVYDAMVKHKFHIVKSIRLKINHVLLAKPGATLEGITEIVSHQQALSQCGAFLKKYPGIKIVPSTNTASAAKDLAASERLDQAVIASRECAELYGLKVLAEDIADAKFNYTRFICISKNLEIFSDANKLSIMLILPHRPGS